MKILAVIINHGTRNDHFARRLIQEYRSMDHQVDIVVLTNVEKTLGEGIEVRVVQPPARNPFSFPFAHRPVIASRAGDYDLFIYTEDDTLITQRNIDAFVWATELLPEHEIAGFIRSEIAPDGTRYYSTVHSHFRWLPESVRRVGEHTFAHYTNEHSGAYILTRKQLRRAMESGGFLVEPYEGRYGMLETAATDPYTRCGMRKMICISRLDDFVLPHLPNKYLGSIGMRVEEVHRQIEALQEMQRDGKPLGPLFAPETRTLQGRWSKNYYEPAREDVVRLLPPETRSVLSVGCGWGATEELLVRAGIQVTAVPMDAVIAVNAAARGIEVTSPDWQRAREELGTRRFDALLFLGVLHLAPDPAELLASFGELLRPAGTAVASLPNFTQLPLRWRRLRGNVAAQGLGSFEETGVHFAGRRRIQRWFKAAGMPVGRFHYRTPGRWQRLINLTYGVGERHFADEILAIGRRG